LLAAAYLALAFLHVRDSHYAVNDVPATLLSTLALYFSLRVLQRGAMRDYLLAGACVGLSAATKYTGLLAGASLLLAHFLAGGRQLAHRRLLAGLVAIGVAFLAAMPYTFLDWPTFAADVGLLAERGAGGFKGLRLAETSGWIFYLETLSWGLGWPLLLAALAGLALALTPSTPQGGVGEGLVLVAFPLLLYLYLSPQLLLFGRFILPAVPVLAALAARAVAALPPVRARAWLLAIAVVLALPSGVNAARHDLLLTRPDTRTLAKAWVETHIPAGTKIITEAYGPELSGGEVVAPRSQRVYDLTVVGTTSLPKKPVTFYRDRGFVYLIVSSFSYERVLLDEEANRERRTFYASLDAEAELVQEFRPAPDDLPFRFDQIYGPTTDLWLMERPGPVIKIYRLR